MVLMAEWNLAAAETEAQNARAFMDEQDALFRSTLTKGSFSVVNRGDSLGEEAPA